MLKHVEALSLTRTRSLWVTRSSAAHGRSGPWVRSVPVGQAWGKLNRERASLLVGTYGLFREGRIHVSPVKASRLVREAKWWHHLPILLLKITQSLLGGFSILFLCPRGCATGFRGSPRLPRLKQMLALWVVAASRLPAAAAVEPHRGMTMGVQRPWLLWQTGFL